ILRFAETWGSLGLCEHARPRHHNCALGLLPAGLVRVVVPPEDKEIALRLWMSAQSCPLVATAAGRHAENISAWRTIAREFDYLLGCADALWRGEQPERESWNAAGFAD